jgi:hypothetical protein
METWLEGMLGPKPRVARIKNLTFVLMATLGDGRVLRKSVAVLAGSKRFLAWRPRTGVR